MLWRPRRCECQSSAPTPRSVLRGAPSASPQKRLTCTTVPSEYMSNSGSLAHLSALQSEAIAELNQPGQSRVWTWYLNLPMTTLLASMFLPTIVSQSMFLHVANWHFILLYRMSQNRSTSKSSQKGIPKIFMYSPGLTHFIIFASATSGGGWLLSLPHLTPSNLGPS